jgi:hypothetical protein
MYNNKNTNNNDDRYGHRIYTQFRKLGSSLDWDRACFTMDEVGAKMETDSSISISAFLMFLYRRNWRMQFEKHSFVCMRTVLFIDQLDWSIGVLN